MTLGWKQRTSSSSWRRLTCNLGICKRQSITPALSFQKPEAHFSGTEKHAVRQLLCNRNGETQSPKATWELQCQVLRYLKKLTKMPKYSLPQTENRSQASRVLGLLPKAHQTPSGSSESQSVSNHPIQPKTNHIQVRPRSPPREVPGGWVCSRSTRSASPGCSVSDYT